MKADRNLCCHSLNLGLLHALSSSAGACNSLGSRIEKGKVTRPRPCSKWMSDCSFALDWPTFLWVSCSSFPPAVPLILELNIMLIFLAFGGPHEHLKLHIKKQGLGHPVTDLHPQQHSHSCTISAHLNFLAFGALRTLGIYSCLKLVSFTLNQPHFFKWELNTSLSLDFESSVNLRNNGFAQNPTAPSQRTLSNITYNIYIHIYIHTYMPSQILFSSTKGNILYK